MVDNILRVSFKGATRIESKPLYQYDYGQIIKFIDLPSYASYEVHFSNYQHGNATINIATSNEVAIPDTYLQNGHDIYVWIYVHTGNDDGETEYQIIIPVIKRAEPVSEEPTSEEQNVITQTIAALNTAVTEARTISADVTEKDEHVTQLYTYTNNAKVDTYYYKEATEAAVNQIKDSVQLGYITIGSTRLTEEQLIKLLQLIED